jgi:phosphate transport system substrate-binding protein
MPRPLRLVLVTVFVLLGSLLAGCTASTYSPPITGPLTTHSGAHDRASLTGAGATFPAQIYNAWFYDYNREVAPGVKINYQSIGSGGGIEQFIGGEVAFGATDAPMTDAELAREPGTQHLPTVLGAVVVTYNLDGLGQALRLDGPAVGGIYLGQITMWDDPAITALNPGLRLPHNAIQVVHRSDGSGTSFVFTDWLSKVSPRWKEQLGAGKAPNWPVGIGGQGNEGVTQVVRQTRNSIGYVELNYAEPNGLAVADIKDRAGAFVTPTLDSIAAAAASVPLPDDYRVSITDAPGEGAYPIASYTFLLLHKDSENCDQAAVLLHMLWWVYHDPAASAAARELLYATLPPPILTKVDATLHSFTCKGAFVLPPAP